MPTIYTQKYPDGAPPITNAATITLNSLASSANFASGRNATLIDVTSNLDLDHLWQGFIKTGTSPTIGFINVYLIGYIKIAAGPTITLPNGMTTSDANFTWTTSGFMTSAVKLVASVTMDSTTSNLVWPVGSFSVRDAFGEMPPYYSVYVAHNLVAALNASGHELNYTRIQKQAA